MVIKRLTIRNFGKIHNRTMELSPGINVLYGENESGKTTFHTFIKSMLYGITRQRGRAAKNDVYATYEPWENPADYGGILWFDCKGESYRLTRNFYKENPSSELLCETTGALCGGDRETLQRVFGDVSEVIYDNTVSVGQLKSVTGQDLVRELQNYMASYQGAGDSAIDLGRASQMLKMSRKGFQVQKDRKQKEIEKEQGKIAANMDYLRREMADLEEKRSLVEEKQQTLRMGEKEENGRVILEENIRVIKRKQIVTRIFSFAALLVGVCLGAVVFHNTWIRVASVAAGLLLALSGAGRDLKLGREMNRHRRLMERWLSRQEKLRWNKSSIDETLHEKEKAYANLQADYRECEEQEYLPGSEDIEIQALNMAMQTIETLSGNISQQMGRRLKLRTSAILSEITGGKYQEVLMDDNFHMSVNTGERVVALERLSRGTLEQIYFALRMAAGELLCKKEPFPVILDDVFGMYDEERLAAVLRWLHKEKKQIIISTCNKREMEILDREGIPYQKLLLQ